MPRPSRKRSGFSVSATPTLNACRCSIISPVRSSLRSSGARSRLPQGLAPATRFDPRLPGWKPIDPGIFRPGDDPVPPLPARDVDIAFAPVTHLARWIRGGALTSLALDRDLSRTDRAARREAQMHRCGDARSLRASRRGAPTGFSPKASISARCMASPGAPRTFSTRQASRPAGAPSPIGGASPRAMRPW